MNAKQIESRFSEMGARLKVREIPSRWTQGDRQWLSPMDYAVDIQHDRHGEFFEFRLPTHLADKVEATVQQIEPKQRHLLMLVRKAEDEPKLDRFLCGHDEREWFVAAVPGGASSVRQAMDRLQPAAIRSQMRSHALRPEQRYLRKNPLFRRQGEWFFFPQPNIRLSERLVLLNEPIRRGRGKPHMVENLVRFRGEVVYVCKRNVHGLNEAEYRDLLRRRPHAAGWGWEQRVVNAFVFARGTVRHSDHATITLPLWHQVLMNTENQSRTMANVAFLD